MSDVVQVRDAFCLHPVPDGAVADGAVAALRGLTLTVAAGERVVVHGPNGSGKTTLLRVLAGEQRLAAGRATVAGLDVSTASPAALAGWRNRRLGWVDQHPARTLRPELDVLGNVALQQRLAGVGAREARAAASETLDRLGIGALRSRAPQSLSGGEAQRVAVCAALAHGPELVLADEPSGELDADAALAVYDALAAAVASVGAALVLVSHDRRAARVADRVVRIRDGRLGETWTPHPDRDEPAGAAGSSELLVVDDRGWLRLPEPLRRATGLHDTARVEREGDSIVLRAASPVEPEPEPRAVDAVEPLPGPTPGPGPVLAQLAGVTKAYGDRTVLSAVDLCARAGQLLVVRGRSGAGKSTLLRVLVGLERPDAGVALLDGVDLAGLDRAGLAGLRRRLAAVVLQDVQLAETVDVASNLALALAVRGRRTPGRETGDAAGPPSPSLSPWLDTLGLAPLARRQARLLSGGERQRVAVARALACGPRLLVLDEPSSQLDEAGVELLAAVLHTAAAAGAAVVVASHDPVLIAAADAVHDLE